MARVQLIFEDTVNAETKLPSVRILVGSGNDPLPIADIDGQKDLDVEKATQAQMAARLAVGEVAGAEGAAELFVVQATD